MADAFPVPSEDVQLGPAVEGDTVRFSIYAPDRKSVHLIGDFNDWKADADPLTPRDDGTWSIQKHLGPGLHEYQYLVDGEKRISDPYSRGVRFNGQGEPANSQVALGSQPFQWRHDDWDRPPFNDLIIYEIAVADFSPHGTIRGLIDRLDHLTSLGINAIELMPVFGFASRSGWGYDPTHFFCVHPDYGTDDDLRELIDTCHARGIAVLLDLVLAHTGTEHSFAQLYDLESSPWYSHHLTKEEQLFGLPSFDYALPGARRFASDVLRHWLEAFHVDGFRLDYLTLIGTCGREGIDLLVEAARSAREDVYLIGEHLPEDPQGISESQLSAAWHLRIARMLRALLMNKEVDGYKPEEFDRCLDVLDPEKEGYDHASRMVNYVESHDEDRLMWELIEHGCEPDLARRKLALAASIVMTMPGEPMIYAGQEWGEQTPMAKDGNPLQWEAFDTDAGRGLFEHHQRLCRLRRDHAALRSGHYRLCAVDADRRTFAFHRWHDEGDEVLVAANFSDADVDLSLPMPRTGHWQETQSQHHFDVSDDNTHATWKLPPWSAAFFVKR